MTTERDAASADRAFFAALLEGNAEALDQILADDFMLIDVLSGSEVPRAVLLTLIQSGRLKFDRIDIIESRVRLYGTAAIVTGRTQMSGRFGDQPFAAASRYTHVFVEQKGRWRLTAAQGTQIAPQ